MKPAVRMLALVLCASAGMARGQAIMPWGVDLAGMDRSIKPGDDFFRYSGGNWMRTTPIPPDRTKWSTFYILRARAEAEVQSIVEALVAKPQAPGSTARKIVDFYTAFLDTDAIERAGLAPVRDDLAVIAAARSHEEIARLMGRPELRADGPMSLTVWPDAKNPDRYGINIVQSGLSLPGRDVYLQSDARATATRAAYRIYIAQMLKQVNWPDADRAADAVLALETAMASCHWTAEKRADRDQTYHPQSRAGLIAFAPSFPWADMLDAQGIPQQNFFVVKEDTAIVALAELFRATPVADWRAYLAFHYLQGMADLLPRAVDELHFDFNGRTLSGQQQQRVRWKRATVALNAALGEAVGEFYVARHFTPQARAQVAELVENLRAAYRERIKQLDWMTPSTRLAALDKLDKLRVKIGYPEQWRDYGTLVVRADDPVGNQKRARLWEWRRLTARLNQRADRDEWGMTPQTVNAYYNAFFNEIVFPAAILQPPYFDPKADTAVNYGGVGGVIGHEMSHVFDDQGAKSDASGALRQWWQEADLANFRARTARLVRQFDQYEVLPDLRVNGQLTLGENIGDNGGLAIAFDAYQRALHGRPAPVLDGFSGPQRFFLSWAQTYRENIREAQLRIDLRTDPHSPAQYRVNGVVRNLDAWYEAFGIVPDQKLYLAPSDRVRIW
ncbi:M13 family metallopeptidase [Duganella sp. Dugasp56]|uniref:M13 family metallopeptidase n=1 Tax=Duganella sp. Dugasp56 TaxID=3243046 RepID=UPI0039AE9F56